MIIIKNIEYLKTHYTKEELLTLFPVNISHFSTEKGELFPDSVDSVKKELIEGVLFKNPQTNEDIYVGYTKEVENVLGIGFNAFETQRKRIYRLQNDINVLSNNYKKLKIKSEADKKELNEFKNMPFWKRIKFLFKGK